MTGNYIKFRLTTAFFGYASPTMKSKQTVDFFGLMLLEPRLFYGICRL